MVVRDHGTAHSASTKTAFFIKKQPALLMQQRGARGMIEAADVNVERNKSFFFITFISGPGSSLFLKKGSGRTETDPSLQAFQRWIQQTRSSRAAPHSHLSGKRTRCRRRRGVGGFLQVSARPRLLFTIYFFCFVSAAWQCRCRPSKKN